MCLVNKFICLNKFKRLSTYCYLNPYQGAMMAVAEAARNIVTRAFGRNWDWSGRSSKHIAFDLRGPEAFTWRKPLK